MSECSFKGFVRVFVFIYDLRAWQMTDFNIWGPLKNVFRGVFGYSMLVGVVDFLG